MNSHVVSQVLKLMNFASHQAAEGTQLWGYHLSGQDTAPFKYVFSGRNQVEKL